MGNDDKFWDRLLKEFDRQIARIDKLEERHNSLSNQVYALALKVSLLVSIILWAAKEAISSFIRH